MFRLFGICIVSHSAYEIPILKLIQYLLDLIKLRNVDFIVIGHKHRKPSAENYFENITIIIFEVTNFISIMSKRVYLIM